MDDLGGDDGLLGVGNPLDGARAVVPVEVITDGQNLLWRTGEPWQPDDPVEEYGLWGFQRGDSVDGSLWAFLNLIDAEPESFVTFARRYGVLAIGANGRPSSAQAVVGGDDDLPLVVEREGVRWYVEQIGAYRLYSVALRGLLSFSIAARGEDPIDGEAVLTAYGLDRFEWEAFGLPESRNDDSAVTGLYRLWLGTLNPLRLAHLIGGRSSMEARSILGQEFSRTWLAWASLLPIMSWEGEPRLTLGFGNPHTTMMFPSGMAFSVIVAQALAVLQSDGFARLDQCALCGRLFEPAIKPGRHTVAYCADHKLEGERARKRKWARRKAQERLNPEPLSGERSNSSNSSNFVHKNERKNGVGFDSQDQARDRAIL